MNNIELNLLVGKAVDALKDIEVAYYVLLEDDKKGNKDFGVAFNAVCFEHDGTKYSVTIKYSVKDVYVETATELKKLINIFPDNRDVHWRETRRYSGEQVVDESAYLIISNLVTKERIQVRVGDVSTIDNANILNHLGRAVLSGWCWEDALAVTKTGKKQCGKFKNLSFWNKLGKFLVHATYCKDVYKTQEA